MNLKSENHENDCGWIDRGVLSEIIIIRYVEVNYNHTLSMMHVAISLGV